MSQQPVIRARAIVRELELDCAPVDLFAELASKTGPSALLESADIGPKYGERSLGAPAPALTLTVRGARWWLTANTPIGEALLPHMVGALVAADSGVMVLERSTSRVAGTVGLDDRDFAQSEAERLTRRTPLDLLRALRAAVSVEFDGTPPLPLPAWVGGFSYDAIEFFESLPQATSANATDDPDLVLHYADWGFVTNHLRGGHTRVIACAFEWPGQSESARAAEQDRATAQVSGMAFQAMPTVTPDSTPPASRNPRASQLQSPPALDQRGHGLEGHATDLDRAAYTAIVAHVKEHIAAGDVFQAVPSRSVRVQVPADLAPIDVYRTLRRLNPSPYMFFVALGADPLDAREQGVLLGASPEMAVRVSRDGDAHRVEIRPIAGTKPRGRDVATGEIDLELDRRYEIELTTDYKELAEHVMLIDLARNDVARVCKPGTRRVDEHFVVERYSHVQHLVSNVSGALRDGLDALTAYAASMNQGTLTGAPKVEAMALLRRLEASARGFYGGAVGLYTHDGDLDTCIVIRSLRLRDGFAYARAGAGVVADSDPDSEFDETDRKLAAPLRALAIAGRGMAFQAMSPVRSADDASAAHEPNASLPHTAHASKIRGHGLEGHATTGVLLIDNVDSFTYNLVDELARLGAHPHVYRNDTPLPALIEAVALHDLRALVISPGPGAPNTAGVTCEAIAHFLGKLPLLGVCLGHQALVHVCGGVVDRAPRLVHGKASRVTHDAQGLFEGIENPLAVGRYHSLAATALPPDGSLIDCAHVLDRGQRVCMAVRHRDHHAHGLQFHPESILTPLGTRLLARFLAIASSGHTRTPGTSPGPPAPSGAGN